ncbi:CCA tRNA nucleotidyltransferase [Salinigranum halophilum]|uniref:CCA tRNA nucleotidyltransferase n=1 Tax=Salinigranum halophilum TaxID=2565931 RepID=UPI0010A9291F|nr:CCA tRNA nucleotidyltransferase [Salinigranum halophilum]
MTELEDVVATVDEQVRPDAAERERLAAAVDTLTERVERALAESDIPAEVVAATDVLQVGSTARGTWLSGDRDIDLFVRFPSTIDREALETYGLVVGRAVLPEGHEEYAEHPYVTGTFDGFDVDLVPCYDVDDASKTQSAVDRTPFHNAYLTARITDDLARDVRVFKRFLKGVGAYGSNLRTRGFSGYLTELLVLEYGGVVALLEAAADWHPPVEFDPEGHGTRDHDDPLVVVDPTDPARNVAAVCSATNVARLQHYARDLVDQPRTDRFCERDPAPLTEDAVRAHLRRRETTPLAVKFDAPDLVDDQLYPQLTKSLGGIGRELDSLGFGVLRSAAFADAHAVLLFEVETRTLPAVARHEGPPVHVRAHAEGFFEAYADDEDVYGPFIEGDRYVVERPRGWTDARAFLASDAVLDVALGKHVESTLETGYDVLAGDAVATLAGEFGTELARYFEPRP